MNKDFANRIDQAISKQAEQAAARVGTITMGAHALAVGYTAKGVPADAALDMAQAGMAMVPTLVGQIEARTGKALNADQIAAVCKGVNDRLLHLTPTIRVDFSRCPL